MFEYGADLEARDDDGRTPLLLAVFHSNEKAVCMLLDKGADWNVEDVARLTPLDLAFCSEHPDLALRARIESLLEQAGAVEVSTVRQQRQAESTPPSPAPC